MSIITNGVHLEIWHREWLGHTYTEYSLSFLRWRLRPQWPWLRREWVPNNQGSYLVVPMRWDYDTKGRLRNLGHPSHADSADAAR